MKLVLNSILGGICIGIAGVVFLSVSPNIILGSILFGFGLLCILTRGYSLFTGVIGYGVLSRNTNEFLDWYILSNKVWLGNLIGCFLVALLSYFALPNLVTIAASSVAVKVSFSIPIILIKSIFCGLLMFVAVDTYKKTEANILNKIIVMFLCVIVFILSGFEHCVANMFYLCISGKILTIGGIKLLLTSTIGNVFGSFIIPLFEKKSKNV